MNYLTTLGLIIGAILLGVIARADHPGLALTTFVIAGVAAIIAATTYTLQIIGRR